MKWVALLIAGLLCCAFTFSQQITVSIKAGPPNTITIGNASGASISNYPLQFGRSFLAGAIPHVPQVLIGGVPAMAQADVKNHYPDGSVEFAVVAVVIPAIPASGSVTLTFQDAPSLTATPLTQVQMLSMLPPGRATMTLTPNNGPVGTADAGQMLADGNCKPWTSGPVAQTMICADDTTARKYDIGFGDGFHPFRPRFYATFWPATGQVFVRVVGENGLTTEMEDLKYKLAITSSSATGSTTVYGADLSGAQATNPKIHWAASRWTKSFWIGSTPSPQVNIDNNLAYLASTRFLPNFDTSIVVSQAGITNEYANWTNNPHDIYDGAWDGGLWQSGMGSPGARQEIAPYPQWTAMWLYTGDWRLRQMALGMADLAAAWPVNLRESDPTRRFLRSDPMGLNPSTGLGRVVSTTDRKTLWTGAPFTYGYPSDNLIQVGAGVSNNTSWGYENSHEPSPFYPQYILTGDPWYLDEMYAWAGLDQASNTGYPSTSGYPGGRGPDGSYGGIQGELRATAWIGRSRAETAFAAPDGSPEKTYFTYLMNDGIARWEGGLQIAGTPYDGTAEKNWGATAGDFFTSQNNGGNACCNGLAPPLGQWMSACNPTDTPYIYCPTIAPLGETYSPGAGYLFVPGKVGSFSTTWMVWYLQYALGREAELGFAAKPLAWYTGQYATGMINISGYPTLVSTYQMPVEKRGSPGGWFGTWPDFLSALDPTWLAGGTPDGGLQAYFNGNLQSEGHQIWLIPGLSMLVDQGMPGAAQAFSWLKANAYSKVPDFAGNPKWAIVPRVDVNVLPPQPTTTP